MQFPLQIYADFSTVKNKEFENHGIFRKNCFLQCQRSGSDFNSYVVHFFYQQKKIR